MGRYLRKNQKYVFWVFDFVLIAIAYIISNAIRDRSGLGTVNIILNSILSAWIINSAFFWIFHIYNNMWVQATFKDYKKIFRISMFVVILNCSLSEVLPRYFLSWHWNAIASILMISFIIGIRVFVRIAANVPSHNESGNHSPNNKNLLIFGAGSAAKILLNDITNNQNLAYNIVGLIDDDTLKKDYLISGFKVLGSRNDIINICKQKKIDEIIVAVPSADELEIHKILSICSETKCKVRLLPSIDQILYRKNDMYKKVRDVQIEDLLARDPVPLHNDEIAKDLQNKVILVTGGGGSIGSELCRQIAKFNPKKLIILDIYENGAYDLQNELKRNYPNLNTRVLIGSVRDQVRMGSIFEKHRPYIVFHAAAHKHVPLMEDSPGEAIKNNVFGTYNVAKCADKYETKKFVLISSDKAVNPSSVMGATKRFCEMIIQSMQPQSNTKFVAVRFGNVLGSNGSVIPLFRKQIEEGGPVTVTSREISRFFMTIPEAAELVLQASNYAKGGEIFVLDMGKPVKIYDLAVKLITLSGYKPNVDIKIKITGLRPGEKLYEELFLDTEVLRKTAHSKIYIEEPTYCDMASIEGYLDDLYEVAVLEDKEQIMAKIAEVLPAYYNPANDEDIILGNEQANGI